MCICEEGNIHGERFATDCLPTFHLVETDESSNTDSVLFQVLHTLLSCVDCVNDDVI